jgi:hypothetical protein
VDLGTTNESLSKFEICAALGVQEIWRYDGKAAHFYRLIQAQYQATSARVSLPILTAARNADFVEPGKARCQTTVRRAFRKWVREQIRV